MQTIAILLLTTLTVLPTTLLTAQESDPQPQLSLITPADRPDSLLPQDFSNVQGLLFEETLVTQLHPLLRYVFFDSARTEIPARYQLFTSPTETEAFSDTTIAGGTLQKYYHLLNIIGYRMKTYPETTITIQGHDSPNHPGENPETAAGRAQKVHDYLTTIWKIEPSRITMLRHGGYPMFRSNPGITSGNEENRRVEIDSDDWEILKPILETGYRSIPVDLTLHFRVAHHLSDSLLKTSTLSLRQLHHWDWMLSEETGNSGSIFSIHRWYRSNGFLLETPPDPFIAQLTLQDIEGREFRSEELEIPVVNITGREGATAMKRLGHYALIQFSMDNGSPGRLNEQILKKYVFPVIHSGAYIHITGHTDTIGLADRNMRLSRNHSSGVAVGIERNIPDTAYASINPTAFGETRPIYTNALPEGRFYNRTVIVETTMIEDAHPLLED